ncbi:putative uncharacterized protein DDB_G0271606 isoform X2 [Acanthaster planci]|uniref:Uncharacterized protein n=1 Tax=Acanthaster planci TaxID=133434 RepID=A0A8B7ZBM9_ACAPL|nr:putative uncharacterized protein DDB_G0271606 isoform X2 [Acanthaster planci]
MAAGSIVLMDSGLADLDKILQSLEIENRQQQNEIQKEQQEAAAFEAAVSEKEKSTKALQEDTARLDEETKAAHQQFCRNKETYESLKNHYLALELNQETAEKELHELQDKWQVEQLEHERLLRHYESVWEQYKAKYEEKELAVELRQWQHQVGGMRQRLNKSQHNVSLLETALQEKQEKKQNDPKPFESLADWIIQIAKAALRTRDLRRQKEEIQQSVTAAEAKIQERTEKRLQQQKEEEEQERKRKVEEEKEKIRQKELERQKQQQLNQQQQLQQLKAQQRQQQQARQQLQASVPTTPHQIIPPQSPLFQQPTRRALPQYLQSPLLGTAVARSSAVPASPQQLRQPPYLQMPILASPRPIAASANGRFENPSQQFTLQTRAESGNNNPKQPESVIPQASDDLALKKTKSPPKNSTWNKIEESKLSTNQRATTSQDEPIRESQPFEVNQKESRETDDADTPPNEAPPTPADDPTSFEDPDTPGSVMSLPPRSPFDLDTHLQSLQEFAKSPGFSYSFRPMFGTESNESEVTEKPSSNVPTSSSDNFESPFFHSFFPGVGGANQQASDTPTQIFGSCSNQASPHLTGTSVFSRPDSPMDTSHSRPPGGILSLFGSGQDKVEERNDVDGSPASSCSFSFNFNGGSDSPHVDSSSEGKFSLF